jgi:hypothetical protein
VQRRHSRERGTQRLLLLLLLASGAAIGVGEQRRWAARADEEGGEARRQRIVPRAAHAPQPGLAGGAAVGADDLWWCWVGIARGCGRQLPVGSPTRAPRTTSSVTPAQPRRAGAPSRRPCRRCWGWLPLLLRGGQRWWRRISSSTSSSTSSGWRAPTATGASGGWRADAAWVERSGAGGTPAWAGIALLWGQGLSCPLLTLVGFTLVGWNWDFGV